MRYTELKYITEINKISLYICIYFGVTTRQFKITSVTCIHDSQCISVSTISRGYGKRINEIVINRLKIKPSGALESIWVGFSRLHGQEELVWLLLVSSYMKASVMERILGNIF